MPYLDPEKQKEAQHRSYLRNKERYIQNQRCTRTKWGLRINKLKDKPCMDCGVKYPYYVMDFDHRNRAEKVANISELRRHSTWEAVLKEIVKCDVVCANCHRKRTHLQNIELGITRADSSEAELFPFKEDVEISKFSRLTKSS